MKTWYDEHGSGEPLVLMHGGLVDAVLRADLPALAEHVHVYTRSGAATATHPTSRARSPSS